MIQLSTAARLFHEDCRTALKRLPDNSVDSCCTDPPYALVSIVKRFGGPNAAPAKGNDAYMRASAGFMNAHWDTGETAFSTEFWAEVLRVLKPGAFVAAFGASRGYHRMACAIEDAGFEIRDSLMWVYGTGFPKSHNVGKGIDQHLGTPGSKGAVTGSSGSVRNSMAGDFAGGEYHAYVPGSSEAAEWASWGTALKPAFEPIVLARKPLSEPTVAANVLKWRTGALNIDASRIGKPSVGSQFEGVASVNSDARETENTNQSHKGRWPANICHDGSDEVVGAFPHTKSNPGTLRSTAKQGANVAIAAERQKGTVLSTGDSGSAARFFYSAKASRQDRNGSKHPTVKPISLMEWLCTLITPPGGTVLDPFAGSGTTGIAATNRGFRVVLCEREAEYVADIKARFDGTAPAAPAAPGRRIYGTFADKSGQDGTVARRLDRPALVDLAALRAELQAGAAIAALQARLRA